MVPNPKTGAPGTPMPGAQLKNPETNGCFTLDRERRALPPMNPALSRKSPEYG